jgi:hypothetical protein
LSSHLPEYVSCPRSRRIAGRAGEQHHQRIHGSITVAGEDIGDPGGEP